MYKRWFMYMFAPSLSFDCIVLCTLLHESANQVNMGGGGGGGGEFSSLNNFTCKNIYEIHDTVELAHSFAPWAG